MSDLSEKVLESRGKTKEFILEMVPFVGAIFASLYIPFTELRRLGVPDPLVTNYVRNLVPFGKDYAVDITRFLILYSTMMSTFWGTHFALNNFLLTAKGNKQIRKITKEAFGKRAQAYHYRLIGPDIVEKPRNPFLCVVYFFRRGDVSIDGSIKYGKFTEKDGSGLEVFVRHEYAANKYKALYQKATGKKVNIKIVPKPLSRWDAGKYAAKEIGGYIIKYFKETYNTFHNK